MFTDIYGFTQMSEYEGRRRLVEIVGGLHTLIEDVVREFDGRVIKSIGDSLMVVFDSPTAAIMAAMDIQKRNRQRNETSPESENIEIRIGLNTGEVTEIDNDVYGEAVNIASRVEGECEPREIYFTEATYLAMNMDRAEAIPVGVRALKGVSRRVKLFRIPAEQMGGALLGPRTLSFFGMFQKDAGGRKLSVFPASVLVRLKSGVIDFWISMALVLLIPLCLRSRPMLAWMHDAIRIEGEHLGTHDELPCTPFRDMVTDALGDLGGVVGFESESPAPNVASMRYFSCHRALMLRGRQRYEARFNGDSGRYDVVLGYRFMLNGTRVFKGDLSIGSLKVPFYRNLFNREPQRKIVVRSFEVAKGELVALESHEDSDQRIDIDFIEFIPESSLASRPFGTPASSRFREFYEMLDYDDRNFHFFVYRIPLYYFLMLFCSYLLFGRAPGNMIMGCYVVSSRGGRMHVGQCLLRSIVLFFHPLWVLFYLKQDKMPGDIISGTKVVVPRTRN